MDPLTAALQLVTTALALQIKILDAMTPAQRAEFGELNLQLMRDWRSFLNLFKPPA